jgi:predicted RND superfamily exporter protein
MKQTFYARHALLILMIVFFCVPFGLRGARQAVLGMKNDVKDWLPSEYDETGDLEWFKNHFLGEQFVVVSWDGMQGAANDQKFELFLKKLLPSTPPSELRQQYLDQIGGEASGAQAVAEPAVEDAAVSQESGLEGAGNHLYQEVLTKSEVVIERSNFIGDDLGLYTTDNDYFNWGGLQEKWLRGSGNHSFYITPEGNLYRWDGVDAPVASLGRWVWRHVIGEQLSGELVKSFGPLDGPWYYENPRRLRAQLFKTVSTGPGVYHSLVNEESGVLRNDPEHAKERLTGTLFGPNGNQTCVVLTLTDAAKRDLHQVLGRGWLGKPYGRLYEMGKESGIPEKELRLGGPPVDNVAIDEEGTITLVRLIGLSVLLGLGLSYACFRSISATIMVFFVGGVSAITSVALVWWLGSSMDAILMSMPSLVYVLGLSGSVHLLNYYHQAIEEGGLEGAAERAVAHAWKPALLCNITTAIGLISLCTSEIVPIRKFGTFAAVGVLAMMVIVFTYLPAVLQIWPQKTAPKREPTSRNDEEMPWLDRYLGGFWAMLGGVIVRNHAVVAIGCTLFIAAVGFGVTRIQTSVNLLKMFDPSAKIIGDYEWLEANLGRLVPMEVVVKVDKGALASAAGDSSARPATSQDLAKAQAIDDLVRLNFLSRMEMTSRVQRTIEDHFGPQGSDLVGRAMSAATFAPNMPAAQNDLGTFMERRATNKKLEEHRSEFLDSDYLREDKADAAELWRISVRLAASKKVDYGSFVTNLKSVVEPVLASYRDREQVIRAAAAMRFAESEAKGSISPEKIDRALNPAGMSVLVVAGPQSELAVGEVDPAAIRSDTLVDLLRTARMKVEVHTGTAELPTHQYDLVVFTQGATASDQTQLAQMAKNVIDLSGAEATSPALTKVSAVYTGVVPIVYKAQQALLGSLIESTKWSFLTITPLMMFVARSWRAGMIAMLPNALPVLVVFGAMGWLNIEVDVGSMMTASIALGVAVDDTIHYLTWFRSELAVCSDRKVAILRTYQRCATPTFQAALISGLGLSIFAFSTFTPTQRFGYLMLTILWAGVASELIYFPALLAGPLGAVFTPAKSSGHGHDGPPEVAPRADETAAAHMATSKAESKGLMKPHPVRQDQAHRTRS